MEEERDSVDAILEGWARERADLAVAPVGIVTRLARVRAHLDAGVVPVFERFGLSPADFQVIVTLARAGAPHRLAQARLMGELGLTSGTVSVRIDRLVRRGAVVREPDPADARLSLVRLTGAGLRLFEEIAPIHLANEDRLLSALDAVEREALAGLLRRLLASFEHAVFAEPRLGLSLEPAHLARARRVAVGLSDTPGLLVAEVLVGSPAAAAGVGRGDLVVAVGGVPVRSEAGLAHALRAAGAGAVDVRMLRGDEAKDVRLRPGGAPGQDPGDTG